MAALDYSQLAALYDTMVTDGSDVAFFLNAARAAAGPVAELMAGTGRLAVPLAEAGIDITCVDSSPEMLQVLKNKLDAHGLRAKVVCDDVTHMNLPDRFALIFIAFHSFEELIDTAEQGACLAAIRRHLTAEGQLICTLHDIESRLSSVGPGQGGRWQFSHPVSQRPLALSLDTEYDTDTGIVHGSESFTYIGEPSPFLQLPLRFRLTPPETFRQLAESAGFVVGSILADYTAEQYRSGNARTAIWTLRAQ